MPTYHRIFAALFLIVGLAVISFIAAVFGPEFAGKIRYDFRRHEKLPIVFISPGDMAYCRTRICDFAFPLPAGSKVIRMDPIKEDERIKGAVDFIDGTICVMITNSQPDMVAYRNQAQSYLPSSRGRLNNEIICDSSITIETNGQVTAIHFHVTADSTPLGYY
jgi:hypothetical protein